MQFSLPQIVKPTETGIFTLVKFTFVFALCVGISSVARVLFWGSDSLPGVFTFYVACLLLVIFLANCILVYVRKKSETTGWMSFHLKRAWMMCYMRVFLNAPFVLALLTLSMDEPGTDLGERYAWLVYANAIVFVPWSIVGLLGLTRDREKRHLSQNDHTDKSTPAETAGESKLVFEDYVKAIGFIIIAPVILLDIINRYFDVDWIKKVLGTLSSALVGLFPG